MTERRTAPNLRARWRSTAFGGRRRPRGGGSARCAHPSCGLSSPAHASMGRACEAGEPRGAVVRALWIRPRRLAGAERARRREGGGSDEVELFARAGECGPWRLGRVTEMREELAHDVGVGEVSPGSPRSGESQGCFGVVAKGIPRCDGVGRRNADTSARRERRRAAGDPPMSSAASGGGRRCSARSASEEREWRASARRGLAHAWARQRPRCCSMPRRRLLPCARQRRGRAPLFTARFAQSACSQSCPTNRRCPRPPARSRLRATAGSSTLLRAGP